MIKLVYIIHGLYNSAGMERILCSKASSLADDYGYDVTIVTSEQKGRPIFFPLSPKVKVVDIGVNYHLPLFTRKLSKLLFDIRPDITVSLCGGDLHHLTSIKDGSAKVGELHFAHNRYYFRPGKGPVHNLIAHIRTRRLERAVRKLDAFIVLTVRDLESWKGIAPNTVQIYNFAEIDTDKAAALLNKRCICVSRLAPHKNIPELILAWEIIHAKHPDWKLDIYGGGSQKKRILKLIGQKGLSGCVQLHSPVKTIREEMLSSSCFVFTSLHEGQPLVLIEAASCGLPIVAYDCPSGPSEIVNDGESGYLIKEHDIEDFARKVCRIIENPDLRIGMGKASQKAVQKFRKGPIMNQWDSLFRSLAKSSRNGI